MADLEKAASQTPTVVGDEPPNEKKVDQPRSESPVGDLPLGEAPEFPTGLKLGLILMALLLNVFIVALDQTIVAPAVAEISNEFSSLADIGWYTSAYLMTTTAIQPFYGRLYGLFNLKWTYLSTIIIFEIGSLICALAHNSKTFIVGRAIAGTGLAGGYIGTLIIIAMSAPVDKQATYTGFIGMAYGAGAVAGPLIGGAFTTKVTWRCGVVCALVVLCLRVPHRPRQRPLMYDLKRLDYVGTTLLLGAVTAFLILCQDGGLTSEWGSSETIGLLVGFPLITLAWIAWEIYWGENASVVFKLMKNRTIFFGAFANFMTGAAYFSLIIYLSIWFQSVQGSSAIRAGVQQLPFIAGAIFFTVVAGITTTAFGYYNPQLIGGFVLGSIGAGLLYRMDTTTTQAYWVGTQFLAGSGFGAAFQLPFIASQTVHSGMDRERGSSIVIFFQTLGGCLLASAAQSIYSNKFLLALEKIPGINPIQVISAGATSFREIVPAGPALDATIGAALNSIKYTFLVAAVAGAVGFLLSLGIHWNDVRQHDVKAGGA